MTVHAPLPHLAGDAASLRQAMAAHFLRGARHVVEIGGAHAPITEFLTHAPESVTVIDPKIEPFEADTLNGRPCRVRHVAAKFQAVDLARPAADYAVVMVGLSLKGFGRAGAVTDPLVKLLGEAGWVVVEHALALERAVEQLPDLMARAGLRAAIDMRYSLSDGVIERAGFGERRLLKLVPAERRT